MKYDPHHSVPCTEYPVLSTTKAKPILQAQEPPHATPQLSVRHSRYRLGFFSERSRAGRKTARPSRGHRKVAAAADESRPWSPREPHLLRLSQSGRADRRT